MDSENKNNSRETTKAFLVSGTPTLGDVLRISSLAGLGNQTDNTVYSSSLHTKNSSVYSTDMFDVMDTVDRQEGFE